MGEVFGLPEITDSVAGEHLEWLSVLVDTEPGGGASSGTAEVEAALGARGLGLGNVAHLKLWIPDLAASDSILQSWLAAFPDKNRRPTVSVLASTLPEGRAIEVSVVATTGSSHRSLYETEASADGFPSAVVRGDFFVTSTLSGVDPVTHEVAGDAAAQAKQAFHRLKTLIEAAGGSAAGIAHMFVWYRDHSERETINEPYLEMFPLPADRPCRHSVVRSLPDGEAMHIEAMGSVTSRRSTYALNGVWHAGIGGVPNSLPFGAKAGPYLFTGGTYGRNLETDDIDLDLKSQLKYSIIHTKSFLVATGSTDD